MTQILFQKKKPPWWPKYYSLLFSKGLKYCCWTKCTSLCFTRIVTLLFFGCLIKQMVLCWSPSGFVFKENYFKVSVFFKEKNCMFEEHGCCVVPTLKWSIFSSTKEIFQKKTTILVWNELHLKSKASGIWQSDKIDKHFFHYKTLVNFSNCRCNNRQTLFKFQKTYQFLRSPKIDRCFSIILKHFLLKDRQTLNSL